MIVLVTDGANNAGEIDPLSAAAVAEGLGLRVYTVGVGTSGNVPVPVRVRDPLTGLIEQRLVQMHVEVDEKLLQSIAERTGGKFFRATDPDALAGVFDRDRPPREDADAGQALHPLPRALPAVRLGRARLCSRCPLLAATLRVTAEP